LAVALACAEGASPPAIAERLFLGVRTVELQLASAMFKLGLKSTAELEDVLRSDTDLAVPQPT
ncbi:MAG TPA: LuxR C-terminal-related transcriptional regulator, partial [Solirubrobacteraceae bacterium]|nr:LuxR C-terminal-related transcriptional regulator [Solirubrobacteraceae bacterium]